MLAVLRGIPGGDLVLARWSRWTRTWTLGCAVTLPGEHPGDLVALPNGEVLLSFGERVIAPLGVRARRSRDAGRTWEAPFVVATVPPGSDIGYPSAVAVGDSVLTMYYANTPGPDGQLALYTARYRR